MAKKYPWYEVVNERQILQGDILNNFEILIPVENTEKQIVDSIIEIYDIIVMTQSCDLQNGKTKFVLLCPPYREHLSQSFAKFFMRVGLPTDVPHFK